MMKYDDYFLKNDFPESFKYSNKINNILKTIRVIVDNIKKITDYNKEEGIKYIKLNEEIRLYFNSLCLLQEKIDNNDDYIDIFIDILSLGHNIMFNYNEMFLESIIDIIQNTNHNEKFSMEIKHFLDFRAPRKKGGKITAKYWKEEQNNLCSIWKELPKSSRDSNKKSLETLIKHSNLSHRTLEKYIREWRKEELK